MTCKSLFDGMMSCSSLGPAGSRTRPLLIRGNFGKLLCGPTQPIRTVVRLPHRASAASADRLVIERLAEPTVARPRRHSFRHGAADTAKVCDWREQIGGGIKPCRRGVGKRAGGGFEHVVAHPPRPDRERAEAHAR